MRSKLYPLKRNIGCAGSGNSWCKVCKSLMAPDAFDSVITKEAKKTSTVFINAWSTFLVVVSNYEMKAGKADSGDWENPKF